MNTSDSARKRPTSSPRTKAATIGTGSNNDDST
jgi:hypothetical protein